MKVVLDTNILVSALWSANSRLAQILTLVIEGFLLPCYNTEIMQEYKEVLNRPHLSFRFAEAKVDEILDKIKIDGLCIAVTPSTIPFVDEDDRCFFDVAEVCGAILVTGNTKHYPNVEFIMTPAQFLEYLLDKIGT